MEDLADLEELEALEDLQDLKDLEDLDSDLQNKKQKYFCFRTLYVFHIKKMHF